MTNFTSSPLKISLQTDARLEKFVLSSKSYIAVTNWMAEWSQEYYITKGGDTKGVPNPTLTRSGAVANRLQPQIGIFNAQGLFVSSVVYVQGGDLYTYYPGSYRQNGHVAPPFRTNASDIQSSRIKPLSMVFNKKWSFLLILYEKDRQDGGTSFYLSKILVDVNGKMKLVKTKELNYPSGIHENPNRRFDKIISDGDVSFLVAYKVTGYVSLYPIGNTSLVVSPIALNVNMGFQAGRLMNISMNGLNFEGCFSGGVCFNYTIQANYQSWDPDPPVPNYKDLGSVMPGAYRKPWPRLKNNGAQKYISNGEVFWFVLDKSDLTIGYWLDSSFKILRTFSCTPEENFNQITNDSSPHRQTHMEAFAVVDFTADSDVLQNQSFIGDGNTKQFGSIFIPLIEAFFVSLQGQIVPSSDYTSDDYYVTFIDAPDDEVVIKIFLASEVIRELITDVSCVVQKVFQKRIAKQIVLDSKNSILQIIPAENLLEVSTSQSNFNEQILANGDLVSFVYNNTKYKLISYSSKADKILLTFSFN